MQGCLTLGRYAGIKVSVHWTFLILPLWIAAAGYYRGYTPDTVLWNLLLIFTVFGCVTLHEFGHALTAKKFKFKTKDIILLPIGGVARMEMIPENPRQEFLVAIAGPAVNFVIAAVLYTITGIFDQKPVITTGLVPSQENFLYLLALVNLFIGAFNLIPAFPMDGGRILRALLAYKLSRTTATKIASHIGQLIAVLFIFTGFLYNLFLIVIGVFIFLGARSEWFVEHSRFILRDYKVSDILMHQFHQLGSEQTLEEAAAYILNSSARNFLIMENNKVVGTLSRSELTSALSVMESSTPVQDIMNQEFLILDPDMPLTEIYNIRKQPLNAETVMPVIQNDRLLGVLDIENISEFIKIRHAVLKKENHLVSG